MTNRINEKGPLTRQRSVLDITLREFLEPEIKKVWKKLPKSITIDGTLLTLNTRKNVFEEEVLCFLVEYRGAKGEYISIFDSGYFIFNKGSIDYEVDATLDVDYDSRLLTVDPDMFNFEVEIPRFTLDTPDDYTEIATNIPYKELTKEVNDILKSLTESVGTRSSKLLNLL